MARTVQDVVNAMLFVLGESADSALALIAGATSAGGTAIVAGDNYLRLINDAKDTFTKQAYLVDALGTLTLSAGDGPYFPLITFTGVNAKAVLGATTLSYTPAAIGGNPPGPSALVTEFSPMAMETFFRSRDTSTAAAPIYWCRKRNDRRVISLNTKAAAGTLAVRGYGIPPDVAAFADTFPWMPDDYYYAIAYNAALMLCLKGIEDPKLAAAAERIADLYDPFVAGIRAATDPATRAYMEPLARFDADADEKPGKG